MVKQVTEIVHVRGNTFLFNCSSQFNLYDCWCKNATAKSAPDSTENHIIADSAMFVSSDVLQGCSCGYCSSRIRRCITGPSDLDVSKECTNCIFKGQFFILLQPTDPWRQIIVCSFRTSGSNIHVMQHNIAYEWNCRCCVWCLSISTSNIWKLCAVTFTLNFQLWL